MGILKVKKSPAQYISIHKYPIFDDNRLSYKAKGLLTYLIGHPSDWQTRVADLIQHGTDGKKAVRSGLKELRIAGYAKMYPIREKGVIMDWNWEIYELPFLRKNFVLPDAYFAIEQEPLAQNGNLANMAGNEAFLPDTQKGNLDEPHPQKTTSGTPDAYFGNLDEKPETLANKASSPDSRFVQVQNGYYTKQELNYKDYIFIDPENPKNSVESDAQNGDMGMTGELKKSPKKKKYKLKPAFPSEEEETRRAELLRQRQVLLEN